MNLTRLRLTITLTGWIMLLLILFYLVAPGHLDLDTREDGTWFACRVQDSPAGLSSPNPPGKIFQQITTVW